MPKIDTTLIPALSEQIEKLPDRTTITPYELVKRVAPVIAAACDRGQDAAAITKLLQGMGVRLSPRTLRNYLSRARREEHSAPKEPPASTPAPAPFTPRIQPTAASEEVARGSRPRAVPVGGRFELVADKKDI